MTDPVLDVVYRMHLVPGRVRESPPRPYRAAPQVVLIAGPNGAGKSTAAPDFLRDELHVSTFVNADVIARGLAGFGADRTGITAGRMVLSWLHELAESRSDFAFETTLAGRGIRRLMSKCAEHGYDPHIVYLWIPDAELAVRRVQARVAAGGHAVPAADIRRRYGRGLLAFVDTYRAIATSWQVFDASRPGPLPLVARGVRGGDDVIPDEAAWRDMLRLADRYRLLHQEDDHGV
jgi:predicted ABC-type ATPase